MNIILIGMSGAGKSTLGVLVAKALGMGFVDTDIVIQQSQGRLLQQIIEEDGLEAFIELEGKILEDLKADNCVIATGGSAVYSERAMRALKQNGMAVYLHVPYDEIERRITDITARGIVKRKGASLKDVYYERVPLYQKHCDITIDCSNKGVEQCVNEIISNLPKL